MLLFFNVLKRICCGHGCGKNAIYHVFMQQNGVSGIHDENCLWENDSPKQKSFSRKTKGF